jgi:hypothetical protein
MRMEELQTAYRMRLLYNMPKNTHNASMYWTSLRANSGQIASDMQVSAYLRRAPSEIALSVRLYARKKWRKPELISILSSQQKFFLYIGQK